METPGRLPLRRFPGLVVELPSGVVPPLLLGGRESLAAVAAHESRRPREAETLPLPLFHLQQAADMVDVQHGEEEEEEDCKSDIVARPAAGEKEYLDM